VTLPAELEWLNARLRRNHFAGWMNLSVMQAGDGTVEIHMPWREEFISNPDIRFTHGGVLATLVDTAASFAIATRLGRPPQTIDMRVDYHATARPGDLVAHGTLVRLGRTVSSADARIYDIQRRLVASGRATFLTAEDKAGTRPQVEASSAHP
jgi:uncharacterized protein (TIGR00369 family)